MKNIFWKIIILSIFLLLINSCGGRQAMIQQYSHGYDKKEASFIHIIIDDSQIKDREKGPQFITKIKDIFGKSFNHVNIVTSYGNPKVGELVLTPTQIYIHAESKSVPTEKKDSKTVYFVAGSAEISASAAHYTRNFSLSIENDSNSGDAILLGLLALAGGPLAWLVTTTTLVIAEGPYKKMRLRDYAIEYLAIDLHNRIMSDSSFSQYLNESKMVRTEMASLSTEVTYSDKDSVLSNDIIDAGEDSVIIVKVINRGKGTGYVTKLLVESDNKFIEYQKEYNLGDIEPEVTKEIKVPIKANLDLPDGKASFTFRVTEKRNFDAKPVVLRVTTNHIERPKLAITSYEINDGRTGMANGNGNGSPENGETVELTAFVKNKGTGDAQGVKLNLEAINSGVEIEQKEASLGIIAPNQTSKGRVAFSIPRTFIGNGITCKLTVSDVRLGQDDTREITLSFEQKQPVLAFIAKVNSRGTEISSSSNGETVELEIVPRNDGGITAKNIQIAIDSSAISLTSPGKSLREILPGAIGSSQRFEIAIPRSYSRMELPVHVVMSQADFAGKEDTITIPINIKAPKLTYTAVISGKHGGNTVEQNEGASLDVQIQNTGDLDAKDVRLRLNIPNPDIKIKGEKEFVIPVIPARGFSETIKFEFFVFRRVPSGDIPVTINMSQADFPAVDFQHKLLVKAEGAEVVEIAGTAPKKSSGISALSNQLGPVLAIAQPISGTRIYEKNVDLSGTVADLRGIDTIRVEINGKPFNVSISGISSSPNKKQFSVSLPLITGENRIRVIARNKDNVSTEETTLVYRTERGAGISGIPPLSMYSDIDNQILNMSINRKPDNRKWAVVVGIEEYRSAAGVPYARRDAQAFKEYLTRRLGVPEENIKTLIDKDAILTDVREAIEDWLPSRVNAGDTVYFYFAGHGVPGIANRAPYLLPHDGKANNPKRSALAASDLYESLGQLKAGKVFVFLDSCFSGAGRSADELQMLIADARIAGFKVHDPIMKQQNIIVFSATETDQVSNIYKEKQHGLFTYFLLKGMIENNGAVRIKELYGYLQRTVPNMSVQEYGQNRKQTPVLKGLRINDDPVIGE